MTRDEHCRLLEDNGWKIISKHPLDIVKYEKGKLVAKAYGQAAFTIVYHLEKDNKLPREITLEQLKEKECYKTGLTVGRLKEILYKYNGPLDGKVLIERVEDRYYEQNNWGVVYVEGEHYNNAVDFNKKLTGEFLNKEEYPDFKPDNYKVATKEELKVYLEQFHPAWCASKFPNDDSNLYIYLHY